MLRRSGLVLNPARRNSQESEQVTRLAAELVNKECNTREEFREVGNIIATLAAAASDETVHVNEREFQPVSMAIGDIRQAMHYFDTLRSEMQQLRKRVFSDTSSVAINDFHLLSQLHDTRMRLIGEYTEELHSAVQTLLIAGIRIPFLVTELTPILAIVVDARMRCEHQQKPNEVEVLAALKELEYKLDWLIKGVRR